MYESMGKGLVGRNMNGNEYLKRLQKLGKKTGPNDI